jgi:hypothetical protein
VNLAVWGDDRPYLQPELGGKFEITLVVSRDSHDCPGAITHEYVIRNPDWHPFVIDRIYGIRSCKDPRLLSAFGLSFDLCHAGHLFPVFFQGRSLLRSYDPVQHGMFRRKDHVCNAEQSIGPRGEYIEGLVMPLNLEYYLGTVGPTDPVTPTNRSIPGCPGVFGKRP